MKISEHVIIIGKRIERSLPEILNSLRTLSSANRDERRKRAEHAVLPGLSDIAGLLFPGEREEEGDWYVVTTTPYHCNLLYIMSRRELLRSGVDIDTLRVLGIAGSRHESREIVRVIFEESAAGGNLSCMKEYLENY